MALRRAQLNRYEIAAALVKAAREGDVNHIARVIAAYLEHADVNARDATGTAPIHAAVREGKMLVVRYLLKLAAVDTNVADADGNTPLITAVKSQQKQIVRMLLKTIGVDVNAQNAAGQTALHCASRVDPQDQPAMVALLAHHKNVSMDIVDKEQKRPLQDTPQLAELFLRIQKS
jgi:ankyrin repeat protein